MWGIWGPSDWDLCQPASSLYDGPGDAYTPDRAPGVINIAQGGQAAASPQDSTKGMQLVRG